MLTHAIRALGAFADPAFFVLTLKAAAATLAGVVLAGGALFLVLDALFGAGWGVWGDVLSGLAIAGASVLLILPVGGFVIGLMADQAVGIVERRHYPGTRGTFALPLTHAVSASLRLLAKLALFNLLALPFYLLLPGLNILIFLVLNGVLAGREFFEMVALRHAGLAQVRAWRRQNRGTIFAGGVVIALAFAVPLVNILAPLFGAAFMVHLFQAMAPARTDQGSAGPVPGRPAREGAQG